MNITLKYSMKIAKQAIFAMIATSSVMRNDTLLWQCIFFKKNFSVSIELERVLCEFEDAPKDKATEAGC